MIGLTSAEKESIKDHLIKWVERVTSTPSDLNGQDKPSPAEIAVLPEMVKILIN